ncbi:flagellar transcriptional regulator FlhD [Paraburkholderia phenazinium]|jgi:flagellar transcriptional activator FlhD|uniref:Flagellar transcriptional regulator FlhD n=1 Tax=Paraburkholderia phenazinium TaxID=60549 RepID=A0A1G8GT82_9BURK|nr:flagellar transcriptional regulator FlhD [Paraburkholderia phenazinium]SDH97606.1 flagellar transcriptional activator FlhD [Paraburkholderia phenazinium]
MDRSKETLDSIREINLSYLMLAQQMLREDKAVGMCRLGLSAELADQIAGLSLAQILKLASADQLLCWFRFNDHAMLSALTQATKGMEVSRTHAAAAQREVPTATDAA